MIQYYLLLERCHFLFRAGVKEGRWCRCLAENETVLEYFGPWSHQDRNSMDDSDRSQTYEPIIEFNNAYLVNFMYIL